MSIRLIVVCSVLLLHSSCGAKVVGKRATTSVSVLRVDRPLSLLQSTEAEWAAQDALALTALSNHLSAGVSAMHWFHKIGRVAKKIWLMIKHCGSKQTLLEGIYLGTGIGLKIPTSPFDLSFPGKVNLIIQCMPLHVCMSCDWKAINLGMANYDAKSKQKKNATEVATNFGELSRLESTVDTAVAVKKAANAFKKVEVMDDPKQMSMLVEVGEAGREKGKEHTLSHEENVALFTHQFHNHAMGHPVTVSRAVHHGIHNDHQRMLGHIPEYAHGAEDTYPVGALLEEHVRHVAQGTTTGSSTNGGKGRERRRTECVGAWVVGVWGRGADPHCALSLVLFFPIALAALAAAAGGSPQESSREFQK